MRAPGTRRHVALPVVGQPGGIRRSRAATWRAAVLVAVHVALLAHIVHWLVAGATLTPLEPSEAMELGRRDVVNAGLLLFLLAAAATAVFGRFFCGWGCHLVAMQDLCQWLLRRVGIRPLPLRSRLLAWVPTLAFVYMFLWPAAFRLATGDDFGPLHVELVTADFWATFPGWAVGIATFFVCGFVIVYLLGAKGFCTYACPYGALFGAADRLAPGRIRVNDACDGCAHCTAVCTSNVRVHEEVRDYGMVVDSGCMKCLDCVSVCPRDALSFGFGRPSLLAAPRVAVPAHRPPARGWGEELLLAGSFALAFFALRGLYGLFPFLFALGLAACFAFLTLTTMRLASPRDLAVRRLQLRLEGRLTGAGRSLVALYTLSAALVLHSTVIQGAWRLGEIGERHSAGLRERVLAGADLPAVPEREAERARRALAHFERAERFGLSSQPGLALRMVWLALLADEPTRLARHASVATGERGQAASAWLLAGLRHEIAGRDDLAANAFRRAMEASPGSRAPYLRLGLSLVEAADLPAALAVFDEGIRRAGAHPDLTYNRALVLGLMGDLEGAIDGFRRTLATLPAHRASRENLAALLAELGRHRESASELAAAVEQAPDDAALRLALARELAAAGDRERARRELDEVGRLAPGLEGVAALAAQLEGNEESD